jgi:hypothetical protein
MGESCETKKRRSLVKSKAKGWFSFGGLDSSVGKQL